ncbi:indole-3-glycerol phosphate synthase TrpC [Sporomusa aerivorans]|uniref:indole-3-glycerol phosphate synthase TrpC n=1 Tax=Sporomusa aerivorans TaxID=204936 RepID=UPI00352B25A1
MLNRIVEETRQAVALQKLVRPYALLDRELAPGQLALRAAISQQEWTLIAECKLASPAKGTLCTHYTVPELADIYAHYGAAALSVHTNAAFRGNLTDIALVKQAAGLPVLCKEFIIDEYQIYAARAAGADAVLLIAAILTDAELSLFLRIAADLGMDALVEVHTLAELQRVQQTDAKLVGINNRDLKTFMTSIEQTLNLLPYCQSDRLIISESGIKSRQDALRLKQAGVKGILVGEGLVTASDIGVMTSELALRDPAKEGRNHNA